MAEFLGTWDIADVHSRKTERGSVGMTTGLVQGLHVTAVWHAREMEWLLGVVVHGPVGEDLTHVV